MSRVGMRELRHHLREYLSRVEAGERFEVTVFDRSVAELGPISVSGSSLEQLIAEGRVTPPLRNQTTELPEPYPVTTGTTATGALLAERRTDAR
jgi:antitoxin (DNA-binding transcriptional repressor) of toxin-antitoxin stability system